MEFSFFSALIILMVTLAADCESAADEQIMGSDSIGSDSEIIEGDDQYFDFEKRSDEIRSDEITNEEEKSARTNQQHLSPSVAVVRPVAVVSRPVAPVVTRPIVVQRPVHTPVVVTNAHNPQLQHPIHHPTSVVLPTYERSCIFLGRQGSCHTIPNFFSCIRDGGVLTPDIIRCSWVQACCIRNFF